MATYYATKARLNVTLDKELAGYIDHLVKAGAIKQGRKVYRSRSAAIEYILEDWLRIREENLSSVSDYLLSGSR